jgi:phosphoenolpyruvate-protein phosphotransferase
MAFYGQNQHKSGMSTYKGVPASPGYARGAVFQYRPPDVMTTPAGCVMPEATTDEIARFREAISTASRQLDLVQDQVRLRLGDSSAAIFDAHSGLLHDPLFAEQVSARIEKDHLTAEYAVALEIRNLEKMFASLDSEYMRERAHDVRDIGNRLVRILSGDTAPPLAHVPVGSIVVAAGLTPSDTVQLDPKRVRAIVTESGGRNSHAAILSRSLCIPSVCGLQNAFSNLRNGQRILVDGTRGTVTTDATESAIRRFSRKANSFQRTLASTRAAEEGDSITRDGVRIRLYGNVSNDAELELLTRFGLDGVGLLRTELMFGHLGQAPRLQRQTDAYTRIAALQNRRAMVVRTFDFSEDKLPPFVHKAGISNSILSLRGLRFSLAQGSILRTQLRALARTSATHKNVRVLLPMVTGQAELLEAIGVLEAVSAAEGVPRPRVGAMIETPAAIFALPGLLEVVDFVAVGTNDLAQYLFATNRLIVEAQDTGYALRPAMIEALYQIASACRRFNRPACVCGEAAGDPFIASLLVGMGYRSLSMSPARAPAVRLALQNVHADVLQETAVTCRGASSATEVERILYDSLPRKVREITRALHTPV